jgi:hypothetical protein
MFRRLTIAAALSAASLVAVVPAASAQTGITLTFGSGGYAYDDYSEQGYDPYRGYYYQQQPNYNYYNYNNYRDGGWRERQRREQIERWRREHAREYYGHREGRYHRRDRDDDDD